MKRIFMVIDDPAVVVVVVVAVKMIFYIRLIKSSLKEVRSLDSIFILQCHTVFIIDTVITDETYLFV